MIWEKLGDCSLSLKGNHFYCDWCRESTVAYLDESLFCQQISGVLQSVPAKKQPSGSMPFTSFLLSITSM